MSDRSDLVVVLLPVYNDWRAAGLLLPRVAAALGPGGRPFALLIVDDGSSDEVPETFSSDVADLFAWRRIIRLRRNMGHQRAIAVGLCHIHEHIPCGDVVVMDADGEDLPEDIPRLLEQRRPGGSAIVFAERRRRAEGPMFRVFYRLYRLLHLALTGSDVKVGNFSVIPRERIASLVVVSELWIHYSASAFRSRQPLAFLPTTRGRRLDGRSKMNFVSLVVHGLSAISVYSDIVFTRIVVAASALAGLSLLIAASAVGIRLFTDLAVPGWATYMLGFQLVILLQAAMFVVALTFQILGARHYMASLPERDYPFFVESVLELRARPGIATA